MVSKAHLKMKAVSLIICRLLPLSHLWLSCLEIRSTICARARGRITSRNKEVVREDTAAGSMPTGRGSKDSYRLRCHCIVEEFRCSCQDDHVKVSDSAAQSRIKRALLHYAANIHLGHNLIPLQLPQISKSTVDEFPYVWIARILTAGAEAT